MSEWVPFYNAYCIKCGDEVDDPWRDEYCWRCKYGEDRDYDRDLFYDESDDDGYWDQGDEQ